VTRTVVFPAQVVRTLDRGRPLAEAVAVRGDRVRAVGSVEELCGYPDAAVDDRFADAVIVPGFVEAHSHTFGAALWEFPYVGYFDRHDPDGRLWSGCSSIEAALDRLAAAEAAMEDADAPLLAWGFDAIYFSGERLVAAHLDRVSRARPMFVLHASAHVATVNSAMLELRDIASSKHVTGVVVGPDGTPNGELQEPAAMSLANVMHQFLGGGDLASMLWRAGSEAADVGCTTIVDLGQPRVLDPAFVGAVVTEVDRSDFPVRLSTFLMAGGAVGGSRRTDELTGLEAARARSTDRVRFGHVKIVLDGSIQQFTARLLPPGYLDDAHRGIWVTGPDSYRELFARFHAAGALIHVHCNGDEATELFLDVLEDVLARHPRWDHRHTVTHSQLTTAAQYRRLAALGGCANVFANHIFYWGDQHRDRILGPDRAARMDAAATALAAGVPISLHCDTPVTPLDPLATMHHAVNRLTATGQVLGPDERITAEQALHAVTLGAAYTLKMDGEIGSIEAGKFADLTVLDRDPVAVPPGDISSVRVLATVKGGVVRSSVRAARPTARAS
jgi:predicted amidohydrolase YtcJ